MSSNFQAIVFPDVNEVEIRSFDIPAPQTNELLVKTLYTMVSSGTELRVLSGRQEGAQFPLIPGYAAVGEIIEVGPKTFGWKAGDLVCCRNPKPHPALNSCWGGQASHHIQPATGDSRPVVLPQGAKPLDYVVAEIGAISWRGAEAVAPQPGETAVVIGQGLIGALSAAWLRILGCRVIVTDIAPTRLEKALARGAAAAVNALDSDAAQQLKNLCPHGPDIIVEASGGLPGLKLAYSLLESDRRGRLKSSDAPRVVLQATYGDSIALHPAAFFNGEGLVLLTPSDRTFDNRQKVVELIRAQRFDSTDYIDLIVPFQQAREAYFQLRDNPNSCFSLIFDWN